MYTGTYSITSQTHAQDLTPDGRFVDLVTVNFTTPSGTHAYVALPAAQLQPAVVDRMIREKIADIEAVHALGSAPHPDNQA